MCLVFPQYPPPKPAKVPEPELVPVIVQKPTEPVVLIDARSGRIRAYDSAPPARPITVKPVREFMEYRRSDRKIELVENDLLPQLRLRRKHSRDDTVIASLAHADAKGMKSPPGKGAETIEEALAIAETYGVPTRGRCVFVMPGLEGGYFVVGHEPLNRNKALY